MITRPITDEDRRRAYKACAACRGCGCFSPGVCLVVKAPNGRVAMVFKTELPSGRPWYAPPGWKPARESEIR